MTTTQSGDTQRDTDRHHAVRYSEAATRLRTYATFYAAVIPDTVPDPVLHTFAETVAAKIRNHYEDLSTYLTLAADQADELAAQYREHLGVS